MVKSVFQYDLNIINALEKAISSNRLTAYFEKTLHNKEKALELYAWNAKISAELYAPLQGLEITLRNSLHRELANVFGEHWYDNNTIPFNHIAISIIEKAKRNLFKTNKPITPPYVVSELSFGFWVALLSAGNQGAYHDKLWTPALHKSFPNINKKRRIIHKELEYLRKLRNRIAHHEPIFERHLAMDYTKIIQIVDWICPDTAAWVDHHNNFTKILNNRP